jgi:hypothetical protein
MNTPSKATPILYPSRHSALNLIFSKSDLKQLFHHKSSHRKV